MEGVNEDSIIHL